jgi:hypothetical protein
MFRGTKRNIESEEITQNVQWVTDEDVFTRLYYFAQCDGLRADDFWSCPSVCSSIFGAVTSILGLKNQNGFYRLTISFAGI